MNLEHYKILQYIADGEYHSGEDIAQLFQTSRAAVSKRVAKLNAHLAHLTHGSLKIETVIGKGYCLNNNFDCLNIDKISSLAKKLSSISNDINIVFQPVLESTNDYLSDKTYDIPFGEYHICLAEQQQKGRGRTTIGKQKTWYSPFGQNIYCSLAWLYPGNQNALIGLSIVAGVAVAELLQEFGCQNINLKWPNDIFVNNKKIGGILIESFGDASGSSKLVIGFGLNIHQGYNTQDMALIDQYITQPWTSLSKEQGKSFSRDAIIANLIIKFIDYYQDFIAHGLSKFLSTWKKYDYLMNKMIKIDIAGNIEHGKYVGINEQGALNVEVNGMTKTYYSGEVSVTASEQMQCEHE